MNEISRLSWHNCYSEGWKNEIVPEAYGHPAKFARGLIRRIYEYALERGYLREGQTVIDPFGGVALGALDAMFHGLHYIGCELEDKFVQLGQQNIDLWNRRYSTMPRWGTATILQGDSRNLVEVLEGARAEGLISSPPYAESLTGEQENPKVTRERMRRKGYNEKSIAKVGNFGQSASLGYGTDPAQLGNMPTGEPPQAIIASPPYIDSADCGGQQRGGAKDLYAESGDRYGKSDGQLAAMREGDAPADYTYAPGSLTPTPFDARAVVESITFTQADKPETIEMKQPPGAIISSPPFADSQQSIDADFELESTKVNPTPRKMGDRSYFPAEMESEGQLAALPEGEPPQVDGIVASPPHEGSMDSGDENAEGRAQRADGFRQGMTTFRYGQNPYTFLSKDPSGLSNDQRRELAAQNPQIGALKQDTFWSAAKIILQQCYAVLAPGGVAIWVLKAFVRNKAIVDFPGQWEALCNSCGFETVEVIRAWLVEDRGAQFALNGDLVKREVARKSFFRRLYEAKARAAEFWKSVGRDDKARHLWQAHHDLWENRRSGLPDKKPPYPTRSRILGEAQMMAYVEAGKPDVEIDTQIDYEVVLVTRKV